MSNFKGWADSWGNSWGDTVTDPNAMRGSASFSITASLQVNAGEMQGSASFSITATLQLVEPPRNYAAEIELRPWYVKRGKKILIFNTADQADSFLDSEREAQEAIDKAKETSRQARRRAKKRVYKAVEHETVDIDLLGKLARAFSIPADIPSLVEQEDYMQLVALSLLAQQIQDEEDIEMLLMA